MRPISEDTDHGSAWTVLKEDWLYIIPIALLVTLIIQRVNSTVVDPLATASVVITSWLTPGHRMSTKEPYEAIRKIGLGILTVASALAVASMVIGEIMFIDLGGKFTSLVFVAAGGQSGLCLSVVTIVCIILDTGMPAPAAYVPTATLAAPALLEFKFSLMSAHLLIVYFSAISVITPPVAVAAYAAAGISEGDPNVTGVQAVRLAVAAYIVSFAFMYWPAFILDGLFPEILWTMVVATATVYSFASGLEGYLHGCLRFPLRLTLMAAGVVLVWLDTWADLIGFAILGAVTAHQYAIRRNNLDPVCLAQPQGE